MFMKPNMHASVVRLEFDAQLTPAGPNGAWCHLHFPGDFEKTFGSRGRVAVVGTINGSPFRSSFMPMCGKYTLSVNKHMQAGAKVKPGDCAHFVLQRDVKPRTVALPPALKKALAASSKPKAVFDKLSYSRKKEYAEWIAAAKQQETVKRRLKKLISVLLEKNNASVS
jgi:hypothetical protein